MFDLNSKETKEYLEYYDNEIIRIRSLLERLGYNYSYGRSLYEDWIFDIMQVLKRVKRREEILALKDYLSNLNYGLSNYYHSYVREELWMGLRSFHSRMEEMVDLIDYESADSELLSKIYGNIDYSINYAENAFLLAAYLLGIKKDEDKDYKSVVVIKKLDCFKNENLEYFR